MTTEPLPIQSKETWSVSVLYEDTETREHAMSMCDHLMRQFWSDIEFDFNWWRFSFLEDAVLARQACNHAMDADIFIVAVQRESELSPNLLEWLERALALRGVREGAFIALLSGGGSDARQTSGKNDASLRTLARRAGLDYFTEAPSVLPGGLPASLDSYSHRAEQHSSLMDDILRHTPPPGFSL